MNRAILCVFTFVACADDPAPVSGRDVVEQYAELVHENYSDALETAVSLRSAAGYLVAEPSPEALEAAKFAWRSARRPYGQSEAFRFYQGPIDGGGPEGQINAWPLDEQYIDRIIENPARPLNPQSLADYNEGELGGVVDPDKAVTTGFHAIEYLLWGADQSPHGPGGRPHTDYLEGQLGKRRGQYLLAAADLLISDLQSVTDAWAPEAGYRQGFVTQDTDDALANMVIGIAILSRGELAGERIDTALLSRDPEDEHSCFSDHTHIDLEMNAVGVQNVWRGRYQILEGPSLYDLARQVAPGLAEETDTAIRRGIDEVRGIPAPFDQTIASPPDSAARAAGERAVEALYDQADRLLEVAHALGLEGVSAELPDAM